MFWSKNKKTITIFLLKFFSFYDLGKICISHGHVFIMQSHHLGESDRKFHYRMCCIAKRKKKKKILQLLPTQKRLLDLGTMYTYTGDHNLCISMLCFVEPDSHRF